MSFLSRTYRNQSDLVNNVVHSSCAQLDHELNRRGGRNPEHIQAYFHWLEPDKVFCEITFFPDDFDSETFSLQEFLSMLSNLTLAAGSEEYYLRYEDASWRHGQHEKDGVILSDKALSLSAP